MTENSCIVQRIQKLQAWLEENKQEALYVESVKDGYYLTGLWLDVPGFKLLVGKKEGILCADARLIEIAKAQTFFATALIEPHQFPEVDWLVKHRIQKLAFDAKSLSYHAATQLIDKVKSDGITASSYLDPILNFRRIKDTEEKEKLKKSACLCEKGYLFLLSQLKVGVTEIELKKRLELFFKEQGGERVSFDPIIAFGAGSAIPHYRSGPIALKNQDLVLIDIGVTVDGYVSDMTRIVFMDTPTAKQRQIYEIVLEAQRIGLSNARPGITCSFLDHSVRQFLQEKGWHLDHGLGHGIGLDIHELPHISSRVSPQSIIEEGMVFTIEPGIYCPKEFGVRIEDSVICTENGIENLMHISKELLILR